MTFILGLLLGAAPFLVWPTLGGRIRETVLAGIRAKKE
jgi:hypothetical protein